jgi:hypothetical protein
VADGQPASKDRQQKADSYSLRFLPGDCVVRALKNDP